MTCQRCGAALTRDEIGLSRKLLGRGTSACLCLSCMSAEFRIPEAQLLEMIERFRAAGCTLFF